MNHQVVHRLPTVEEYNELRSSVEWPQFQPHLVREALANTLFSVVIVDYEQRLMGMGRIIGDRAIYLHIQDVIVKPEFQCKGIGKAIMDERLMMANTSEAQTQILG
jgi:ribosomal protein S18 acetylase RimI-like enzyme